MSKSKEEILAEMIREKCAAGLTPAQAKECAERQLAHDEALAAASAKPAKPDEAEEAKGEKASGPKPASDPKKK